MKVKDPHIVQLFLNMAAHQKHIWSFRGKNAWAFVFFLKKFQYNFDIHLNFKKWLQIFLLNGSFTDTEFYYFLLTNHDSVIVLGRNHNSRRCLSVFTINSQTKKIITIASHNGNMINLTI